MFKKKGVSLVVLVITIIVTIILSGGVFIGLNHAGILKNTQKAKFLNAVKTYKDSLASYHSNKILKSPYEYNPYSLNIAPGIEMGKYIKEMREEDYYKFLIRNGELVYNAKEGYNKDELDWTSGLIGNTLLAFNIEAKTVPDKDTAEGKTVDITVSLSGEKVDSEENKNKPKNYTIIVEEDTKRNPVAKINGMFTLNSNFGDEEKIFSKEIYINDTDNTITGICEGLKTSSIYKVSAKVKIDGETYYSNENENIIFSTDKDKTDPYDASITFKRGENIITFNNEDNIITSKDKNNITAVIELKDDELGSGISLNNSKYIFNREAEIDENKFNTEGKKFNNIGNNNIVSVILNDFSINGDYYLHVLSVDNMGNKKITNSKKLEYKATADIKKISIIVDNSYARQLTVRINRNSDEIGKIYYTDPLKPGEERIFHEYKEPFIVTKNGTIIVKAEDIFENSIDEQNSFKIEKIDKLFPNVNLTPNGAKDVKSIEVSVLAIDHSETSEDCESGISEIKYQWRENGNKLDIDDISWNSALTINKDGAKLNKSMSSGSIYLHILARDKAGNTVTYVSDKYTFDNTPPKLDDLKLIIAEEGYHRELTVSIVGRTPDMARIEYTLPDSNKFINYTKAFKVNKNGVIKVRVLDNANNQDIKEFTIDRIDNVSPSAPVITNSSNGNVTRNSVQIKLQSTDNLSGILRYEWYKNGIWTTDQLTTSGGEGFIAFLDEINEEIIFRAVDKALNVSPESRTRVNIDRTAPDITNLKISVSNNNIYTKSKEVRITGYPIDAVVKEYNIDGSGWKKYVSPFMIDKNCTIYARVMDTAGNEASVTSNITKIDNTPPVISDFTYSVTENSININNIVCSDNVGVTHYQYITSAENTGKITNSTYKFNGLSSGTNYNVKIIVYDQAGNMASKTINGIRTSYLYTIKYSANGATNVPEVQTKVENKAIKLSNMKPEKRDFKFLGWSKSSAATSVDYNPGADYNENANITLYAVWRKASYLSSKVKEGSYVQIPGSTLKWVVLYKNSKGIEVISMDKTKDVMLSDKEGYADSIYILNGEAEKYRVANISKYASRARSVGSNPDNPAEYDRVPLEYLVWDQKYWQPHIAYITSQAYTRDYDQMKKLGINDLNKNYWITARKGFYSGLFRASNFYMLYVDTNGNVNQGNDLYGVNAKGVTYSKEQTCGLRPCMLLYYDVETSGGDGSSGNPYILTR